MKTTLAQPQDRIASALRSVLLPLAAMFLIGGVQARAATNDIWVGGGQDSKWLSGANWASGNPPSPNDWLTFSNTVRLVNTNNLGAGFPVSGITFATPSGGFNLLGSSLTLNGGLTNNQVVTLETISLPLALGATPSIDVVNNAFLTLAGAVSGSSFGLTKVDGGTLTLSAANTFGGPLTVSGGTLSISSDANLGTAPSVATAGNLVLNGGTLQTTNAFTINTNRGLTLGPASGSGGGTFDIGTVAQGAGLTVTYGGVMANNGAGTGGLTKQSFGALTLFGKNTYTGPTTVKNGTLTLDFSQAGATTTSNIINANSALTLGGATSGAGVTNWASLIIKPQATATNTQNFNGTTIDLGQSFVQGLANGAGTVNINLGLVTNKPGGVVNFILPALTGGHGTITTTATNVNGILGGWATISDGSTPGGRIPSAPTNFASVDASGNITNYKNYSVYASGLLKTLMQVTNNILLDSTTTGDIQVDTDLAGSTNDVNTISMYHSTNTVWTLRIGSNNVVRVSQAGAIFNRANNAGVNWGIGPGSGGAAGPQNNAGMLTAGGPTNNTPGQLVVYSDTTGSASADNMSLDCQVVNNGTGPVTLVKAGPGFLKLRNHNTYSGGTYILQGRIQLDNSLTGGTPIPDAFGTGPVFIFPGGNIFFSGTAPSVPMANPFFVAGASTQQEPQIGALRTVGGWVITNTVTMIGDTTIGGNGGVSGAIAGRITGPFNLSLCSGGTVNGNISISSPLNDWTGNTTIQARTLNNSGNNIFISGANEIIPDGFGKGNVIMLAGTVGTVQWNLNGFSETINGLSTSGPGANSSIINSSNTTTSTLTVGNNNQSGTFGGNILNGAGVLGLTKIGGGIETLTGTNNYLGPTIINGGTLALGGSGSISNSAVQVNSGATFDISAVSATAYSTTNSVGLSSGALIGNTAAAGVGSLNLTNAGLSVIVNPSVTNLFAATLTTGSPTNLINILSVVGIASYPTQFTIIKYTGAIGGSGFNFGIGATPSPSTQGYVSNDTANLRVLLVLNNGPKPLIWNGNVSTSWDLQTTTNWLAFGTQPAPFFNADSVQFDDTATVGSTNVNLTTNLQPAQLAVTNNVLAYSFSGSGSVYGSATLLKEGSGTLTVANTGVNATIGGVTVSGGTLVFATDNAMGGGVALAAGTTLQVGTNGGTGTLPSGNVDDEGSLIFDRGADLPVPNNISGGGALTKIDANVLILSGNNSYTGAVLVTQGTLQAGSGSALGTVDSGTTISSGATLDVGGQNLGAEPIIVSGAGVGGTGAISNSGPDQINALQHVTLVGDTTFGGTGRWDIRGTTSTLSTSNQAFNIFKVGPNQVALVGPAVDTALGNINIQQGIFGFQLGTSGAGAPGSSINVSAGATLEVYNLAAVLDKNIVLNGDGVTTTLAVDNGAGNNITPSLGSVAFNGNCIVTVASGVAMLINSVAQGIGGTGSLTGPGAGTLTLAGACTYPGNTTVNGGKFVLNGNNTGGGAITCAAGATLAGTGGNTGPVAISGGFAPGDTNNVGTFSTGPLTLNSAALFFDLANIPDLIAVTGNLVLTGTNSIQPAPVVNGLNGGQLLTNITYSGMLTGASNNFVLLPSLPGYAFHLLDPASTPGAIVISVDHVPAHKLWKGADPLNPTVWDTGVTTNWINQSTGNNPDVFTTGDDASFDDSGATNVVSLSGSLDTTGVTMLNNAVVYTITGSGKLTGAGGLLLQNSGKLILDNSGSNDFTGATALFGGVLQIGNGDTNGSLGPGVITNDSTTGGLVFDRSDTNLVLANQILGGGVGTGYITNTGSGMVTLRGNNSGYNGSIIVQNGTLRALTSTALGNPTNVITVVSNGATLDLGANADNFGIMGFDVVGAGVGGNGAIVNSSGSATFVGPNIANALLEGDLTIGGTGRWDWRDASGTNFFANLNVNPPGTNYNLFKVGTNLITLVGVQVDASFGNFSVESGTLVFQGMTTLGNPTNTVTVLSNATLQLFALIPSAINPGPTGNKALVLKGGSTFQSANSTNTWSGPVSLFDDPTFDVTAAALVVSNNVGGAGSLIKSSGLPLFLTGANNYTGNTTVSGGALVLSSIPPSPVFDISGATATLDVTLAGGALSLGSGQTIQGLGALSGGLIAGVGALVAPGETNTLGTLTVTNGSVTLGGTTTLKLNRNVARSNDVLSCASGLALGGALNVINLGTASIIEGGDTFNLLSGPLGGSFAPVSLPPLWPGLSWNTANLNGAGSLSVVGAVIPPQVTGAAAGTNFVLSGSGGLAGATYYVLSSTNLLAPLTNWRRLATNTYGVGGTFTFTNVAANPQQFYTLEVP